MSNLWHKVHQELGKTDGQERPLEFHLHKLCEFLQSALLVPRELKSQKLAQIIKSSTVPYEGAVSQACLLGLRCPPC